MVKKADNRRSMAVMAAWLVTTGIGVTAYAAAMSQADEPDATAAPAYVQTVGDGIAADPSSSGAKALRALERTHEYGSQSAPPVSYERRHRPAKARSRGQSRPRPMAVSARRLAESSSAG
jgi:hypothetical protein